jgi:hypothetical protein
MHVDTSIAKRSCRPACAHAWMPACRHVRRGCLHVGILDVKACMHACAHPRMRDGMLRSFVSVPLYPCSRGFVCSRRDGCKPAHTCMRTRPTKHPCTRASEPVRIAVPARAHTQYAYARICAQACARPSAYAFMDAMHTVHAHTARTHMPLAYAHHIPSHADTHSYLQYIGMSADTRVRGTRSRARGHIPAHVNIHAHMNACMHTGSENEKLIRRTKV